MTGDFMWKKVLLTISVLPIAQVASAARMQCPSIFWNDETYADSIVGKDPGLLINEVKRQWSLSPDSRDGMLNAPGEYDQKNLSTATLKFDGKSITFPVYFSPDGVPFGMLNWGPRGYRLSYLNMIVEELAPALPRVTYSPLLVQFADGRSMLIPRGDSGTPDFVYPSFAAEYQNILSQNPDLKAAVQQAEATQIQKFRAVHSFDSKETTEAELSVMVKFGSIRPSDMRANNLHVYRFLKTGDAFLAVQRVAPPYVNVTFIDLSATLSGPQNQRGALEFRLDSQRVDVKTFGTQIQDVVTGQILSLTDLSDHSFSRAIEARRREN